jgi:SAM-dependent methyltransferase
LTIENIHYASPEIERFYREHRTRWSEFYESERMMFERLQLNAPAKVLDIGCGCGGLGLALRERFGIKDYTGIEINAQSVETARRMNPAGRFLNADVLAVSAVALPDTTYDLVVSLSCIDWNVEFDRMLARAWDFVKPGGHFLSSFRITSGKSISDISRSYQYINFAGKHEGETAPYVVLNFKDLLTRLNALHPAQISGYGYWGAPSATAVTVYEKICFAVLALEKPAQPVVADAKLDLQLPDEILRTLQN